MSTFFVDGVVRDRPVVRFVTSFEKLNPTFDARRVDTHEVFGSRRVALHVPLPNEHGEIRVTRVNVHRSSFSFLGREGLVRVFYMFFMMSFHRRRTRARESISTVVVRDAIA